MNNNTKKERKERTDPAHLSEHKNTNGNALHIIRIIYVLLPFSPQNTSKKIKSLPILKQFLFSSSSFRSCCVCFFLEREKDKDSVCLSRGTASCHVALPFVYFFSIFILFNHEKEKKRIMIVKLKTNLCCWILVFLDKKKH